MTQKFKLASKIDNDLDGDELLEQSLNEVTVRTKTIALERLFEQAVAESWPLRKFTEETGIASDTVTKFLNRKLLRIRKYNEEKVLGISRHAGAIFNGAIERQLTRLVALGDKPLKEWKPEDFRLEAHAISMLKPLLNWGKAFAITGQTDETGGGDNDDATPSGTPRLSDGL